MRKIAVQRCSEIEETQLFHAPCLMNAASFHKLGYDSGECKECSRAFLSLTAHLALPFFSDMLSSSSFFVLRICVVA